MFVENLKIFMAQANLNARRLSIKAGLNERAVTDILEGNSKSPRQSTVKALADALGVSVARLTGEDESAHDDDFMRIMGKIDDPGLKSEIQSLVLRRLLEKNSRSS